MCQINIFIMTIRQLLVSQVNSTHQKRMSNKYLLQFFLNEQKANTNFK